MARFTIPFTKQGFDKVSKEYQDLLSKRPEIVKELTTARDMGDRSENAAYKSARRKLSSADSRLRFLKKIVEHGKVVIPSQTDYIEIGSIVHVSNGTSEMMFHIVGEYEADPLEKRLSYKSPVGQALLRRKAGETVKILIPTGTIEYNILEIAVG